jgi:hypothetical protein
MLTPSDIHWQTYAMLKEIQRTGGPTQKHVFSVVRQDALIRVLEGITHRLGATGMNTVLSTLRSSRKLPQLVEPRDGRTEKS